MTKSSVKADKVVQRNRKIHQTLSALEATNKPNHASVGQLAKTKNSQNTRMYTSQAGGGEVSINPSSLLRRTLA